MRYLKILKLTAAAVVTCLVANVAKAQPASGAQSAPGAQPAPSASPVPPTAYTIVQDSHLGVIGKVTQEYCFAPNVPCAASGSLLYFKPNRGPLDSVSYAQPITMAGKRGFQLTAATWRDGIVTGKLSQAHCFANVAVCLPGGASVGLEFQAKNVAKLHNAQFSGPANVLAIEFAATAPITLKMLTATEFVVEGQLAAPTTVGGRSAQGAAAITFRGQAAVSLDRGVATQALEFHGWQLPVGYIFSEPGRDTLWEFQAGPNIATVAKRLPTNDAMDFGDEVSALQQRVGTYNPVCGSVTYRGVRNKPLTVGQFKMTDFAVTYVKGCPASPAVDEVIYQGNLANSTRVGSMKLAPSENVILRNRQLVALPRGTYIGATYFNAIVEEDHAPAERVGDSAEASAPQESSQPQLPWVWSAKPSKPAAQKRFRGEIKRVAHGGHNQPPWFIYVNITATGQPLDTNSRRTLAELAYERAHPDRTRRP